MTVTNDADQVIAYLDSDLPGGIGDRTRPSPW
jgi:hypothetical protein